MSTQIFYLIKYEFKGTKGHKGQFYVYFNLNLRSYGQLLSLFCFLTNPITN